MNLFVRESGPVGAPAIVFLHGGTMSGWSWEPVVQPMQGYRCLVPDLTGFGKSSQQGPFEMDRAADAVAEVIRSQVGSGRAHVVGLSLGAQVGVQLMATEPKLVDRAVLCGTVINTMPGARVTGFLLGSLSRNTLYRWVIKRYRNAHLAGIPVRQHRRLPRGCASHYGRTARPHRRGLCGVHPARRTRQIRFAHAIRNRRQGDAGRTPLGCSTCEANA